MLNRQELRTRVGEYLKREYVALLGQQGSCMQTFIETLVNRESPIPGMSFISLALPSEEREKEFYELLLGWLIDVVDHVPPERTLRNKIIQELEKYKRFSATFRFRKALDRLGWETHARPLVIVLQSSLAHAPEKPLERFLRMLRDYHEQRNIQGGPEEYLRFLAVGDVHLWKLCYEAPNKTPPFSIAKRVFLDDLSYQELTMLDRCGNSEAASYLWSLTSGVPALIEKALTLPEMFNGLSPFFEEVEGHWNSLPEASRQLLMRLAQGEKRCPNWRHDYNCQQIPNIGSPWLEAFWKGFLCVRQNELAWHSPIHRAFVLDRLQGKGNNSIDTQAKVDLLSLSLRLQKALNLIPNKTYQREQLEEALSLTHQIPGSILAPILEVARHDEKQPTILEKVSQVATISDKGWMKALQEKVEADSNSLPYLLIDAATWETKRLQGDFDVFLCHNSEDKPFVKEIAEKLLAHGILPWLDEWELCPGLPWQRLLEQQIAQIKTAAVFVGSSGIGPWHQLELEAFLREFVRRGCPVIPVLREDAPQEFVLPLFLQGMTCVDFRKSDPDPMRQLIWGITGTRKFTRQ